MLIKSTDLESMSVDDLWSVREQINQVLSARITTEKRELEKRLAVLNGGRGLIEGTETALSSNFSKTRRKYPRVLPKYRNPLTSETWSGRGKKPRWLVAAIKTGCKIEDFQIDGASESKGLRQRA